jgi:CheY-like chemotaxis protein
MPGMNGQETLKAIKADPDLRDIPVVMMTGVCDETEMKLAAEERRQQLHRSSRPTSSSFLKTVLASTSYWLTITSTRSITCRRKRAGDDQA